MEPLFAHAEARRAYAHPHQAAACPTWRTWSATGLDVCIDMAVRWIAPTTWRSCGWPAIPEFMSKSATPGGSPGKATWRDAHDQVKRVYQAFGGQRIMWGTDWPVSLQHTTYDKTLAVVRDRWTCSRRRIVSGY